MVEVKQKNVITISQQKLLEILKKEGLLPTNQNRVRVELIVDGILAMIAATAITITWDTYSSLEACQS